MPLKHFFGNLAVGKKPAGSFAVLLILLAIVSAVGIFSLSGYNRGVLILKYANTSEIALLEAERAEKNFTITQDTKYIQHAFKYLGEAKAAVTPLIDMQQAGSEDRQQAEQILDGVRSYEGLLKRYETSISGPADIARSLEKQMYAIAGSTIDSMEGLKQGEETELLEIYDLAVAEVIIVTVIALIVVIALARILTRSITRPTRWPRAT